MARIPDPVAIRNPKLPGVVKVISRKTLASRTARGWVEAKSPEAKAAVEAHTPPTGDNTATKEATE